MELFTLNPSKQYMISTRTEQYEGEEVFVSWSMEILWHLVY